MNELISGKQLIERYGRSNKTLYRWVKDGKFPQPVKVEGRVVGWHKEDIERFENKSKLGLVDVKA